MLFRILVVALSLLATPALAAEFTGRVADVLDGDTLAIVGMQEKVRLADVDAPETAKPGKPGQPYGEDARRALKALVGGKDVLVQWRTKDRYGRYIGTVNVAGLDVNAEMVRGGHAWVYEEYTSGKREAFLALLENQAQNAKLGLWALPAEQQIEPWVWRKGMPAANDNEDQSVTPPGLLVGPECGTKKKCSQMTSCAEANAFFTECKGMGHLDGNKDGVPCDEKCR